MYACTHIHTCTLVLNYWLTSLARSRSWTCACFVFLGFFLQFLWFLGCRCVFSSRMKGPTFFRTPWFPRSEARTDTGFSLSGWGPSSCSWDSSLSVINPVDSSIRHGDCDYIQSPQFPEQVSFQILTRALQERIHDFLADGRFPITSRKGHCWDPGNTHGPVLMAHCGNHYSHNYALSVILEHKNSFLITRSQELTKEKPEMRIW